MQSKRQPKVHTYSKKRRRKVRPGRAILSIGFTFLVAGVIGVVGYSVAKPILQYSGCRAFSDPAGGDAFFCGGRNWRRPEGVGICCGDRDHSGTGADAGRGRLCAPVSALESKQALQAAGGIGTGENAGRQTPGDSAESLRRRDLVSDQRIAGEVLRRSKGQYDPVGDRGYRDPAGLDTGGAAEPCCGIISCRMRMLRQGIVSQTAAAGWTIPRKTAAKRGRVRSAQ